MKGMFKVTGISQIKKALLLLERRLVRKVISQVLREANKKFIKPAVEQNAPEDTGKLKRAIKIKAQKRKRGSIGVNTQIGDKDFQGETFYAAFQEYLDGPNKGFMRKAFDEHGPEAKAWIESEFIRRFEIEVRRARRN